MGIYFIAAGKASNNRGKTLDNAHTVKEISEYLIPSHANMLRQFFKDSDNVYVWGANERSAFDLSKVRSGEYVVDVNNAKVVQVFKFAFSIKTTDTRIQDYLGWDEGKPPAQRRPYGQVFFLMSPCITSKNDKKYFQAAFGLQSNINWLVGQRYFDDNAVEHALGRVSENTVESFIGINSQPLENKKILSAERNNLEEIVTTQKADDFQASLEKEIDESKRDGSVSRQKRLETATKKPKSVQIISLAYVRNADVIVEVLLRAKGICEKCNSNAPFTRKKDNTPYLEVHHKLPLSEGGFDIIDNAIAVCPNCHRELHFG